MAAEGETVTPVAETVAADSRLSAASANPDTPQSVTPQPAAVSPPPPPAPPAHDPWLVRQAVDLGIPSEDVSGMTPGELQRACYLLNKQRTAIASQVPQQQQTQQAPAPEPDFTLPAELKAKLGEFDPAIAQAVEFAARSGVDRAKKAEAELVAVKQQISQQAFVQQVNAAMNAVPAAQRDMVMARLAQMERAGELAPGMPPHVAVPLAHKSLLDAFGVQPAAASPPPPPAPTPTPTAPPTNRLAGREELQSPRDLLLAAHKRFLDEQDETRQHRNGAFRP